jgi:hypothetical protein
VPRLTFIIRPERQQWLDALALLTRLNVAALQRHRLPSLYRSGVRYVQERRGLDDWLQAPEVYRRRKGDCEDLGAWRAAELQLGGEPGAFADCRPVPGRRRWHTFVRRADGTIEDPSRILGMGRRNTRKARTHARR